MKKQQLMENELQILASQGDRALSTRLDSVEGMIPTIAPPDITSSISNLIDNSDFAWSTDAYTTPGILPGDVTKPNNRVYNWYWMERATALLVEDETHSLKGPDFPPPDADDIPRWNKINGWAELGESGATPYDICCPLPNNYVTPGMRLYLQMLVRLRTSTAVPGDIKFFWEFWDNTNTAPLPDIIKGSAFTLTAATFGIMGATTRDYKLIVETDAGDEVESTVATVTDAPASLTPTNGVSLAWPRYPGFTQVSIYVTVGGNSFLVGIVGDGSSAFLDTGQTLRPVDSVPSVSGTVARAYAQTRVFVPSLDWVEYDFSIIVPSTYNLGLTTDRQWLRGGVVGLMGDSNQLQIDRIGVSTGFGLWSISANDKNAKSLPSTSQTGSTQGPPSGGGGPPVDGGGGPRCSTRETLIQVCDKDGMELDEIRLDRVTQGMYLVGLNGRPNRVTRIRPGWSDSILTIATANGGRRRCSPSDRWLIENGDPAGTPARELCEGVRVITRINGVIEASEIVSYSVSTAGEEVLMVSTGGNHVYFAGQIAAHNMKPDLELGP